MIFKRHKWIETGKTCWRAVRLYPNGYKKWRLGHEVTDLYGEPGNSAWRFCAHERAEVRIAEPMCMYAKVDL